MQNIASQPFKMSGPQQGDNLYVTSDYGCFGAVYLIRQGFTKLKKKLRLFIEIVLISYFDCRCQSF